MCQKVNMPKAYVRSMHERTVSEVIMDQLAAELLVETDPKRC